MCKESWVVRATSCVKDQYTSSSFFLIKQLERKLTAAAILSFSKREKKTSIKHKKNIFGGKLLSSVHPG